jgi:hypothetical protein
MFKASHYVDMAAEEIGLKDDEKVSVKEAKELISKSLDKYLSSHDFIRDISRNIQ